MKGTPHNVYLDDDWCVNMCNVQDDHYYCKFETRDEIEEFITQLLIHADEAWPKGDTK